MKLSAELELVQEITEIADLPPTPRRLALLRDVLSRAEEIGGRVDDRGRHIVIQFSHLQGSFAVSVDVVPTLDVDVAVATADHGISPDEVAQLVNDGVLTREIDESVGWDPELAV